MNASSTGKTNGPCDGLIMHIRRSSWMCPILYSSNLISIEAECEKKGTRDACVYMNLIFFVVVIMK